MTHPMTDSRDNDKDHTPDPSPTPSDDINDVVLSIATLGIIDVLESISDKK